jgi:uncharacterized protein YbjT (DUF2867 family)
MRVFLTGGTGFVGQEVVKQLHAAGHWLRLLVRNANSAPVRCLLAKNEAEAHAGDVTRAESLAGALGGIEALVHLVGIISEAGESTFENVHVRGTKNIVEAAKQAGVRRFVHMSALGTRAGAPSRYHQTKWGAEETVRGSGLDYTIFRPSLIYGPGDELVNLFAGISRVSPVVPVLGAVGARFQPVAVEAVAAAFTKAAGEPRASGQTYDLCGPERFTMGEMLDEILAVLGRRRLKIRIPAGLARCQAAVLEAVFPRVFGKAPPLNRDQLMMLGEDNVGDPGRADELFGLRHERFSEGIAKYLRRSGDEQGS